MTLTTLTTERPGYAVFEHKTKSRLILTVAKAPIAGKTEQESVLTIALQ